MRDGDHTMRFDDFTRPVFVIDQLITFISCLYPVHSGRTTILFIADRFSVFLWGSNAFCHVYLNPLDARAARPRTVGTFQATM